jgi:indole-3-glycerol phosphate synthase
MKQNAGGRQMITDVMSRNRKRQIMELKKQTPLSVITERASLANGKRQAADLYKALKAPGLSVIGELKRVAPHTGVIREKLDAGSVSRELESAGACAVSVITEETYYKGSAETLSDARRAVRIPVICKDFFFDEWYICLARSLGADAVQLASASLDLFEMKKLISVASMFGMQCIVMVNTARDVESALRAGATIIGVNSRNPETFEIDLGAVDKIRRFVPGELALIAESGVKSSAEMRQMARAGADAVMVGEALMRAESITLKMRELLNFDA